MPMSPDDVRSRRMTDATLTPRPDLQNVSDAIVRTVTQPQPFPVGDEPVDMRAPDDVAG
jgi:hypothetical protein